MADEGEVVVACVVDVRRGLKTKRRQKGALFYAKYSSREKNGGEAVMGGGMAMGGAAFGRQKRGENAQQQRRGTCSD